MRSTLNHGVVNAVRQIVNPGRLEEVGGLWPTTATARALRPTGRPDRWESPCRSASGSITLPASPAARVSQFLSQGCADEGLHPYLVPHAKLLESAGRAERNPSGELRQVLVLMLAGEHLHVAITL